MNNFESPIPVSFGKPEFRLEATGILQGKPLTDEWRVIAVLAAKLAKYETPKIHNADLVCVNGVAVLAVSDEVFEINADVDLE